MRTQSRLRIPERLRAGLNISLCTILFATGLTGQTTPEVDAPARTRASEAQIVLTRIVQSIRSGNATALSRLFGPSVLEGQKRYSNQDLRESLETLFRGAKREVGDSLRVLDIWSLDVKEAGDVLEMTCVLAINGVATDTARIEFQKLPETGVRIGRSFGLIACLQRLLTKNKLVISSPSSTVENYFCLFSI